MVINGKRHNPRPSSSVSLNSMVVLCLHIRQRENKLKMKWKISEI
jgi:hypothetical protein